MPAEVRVEQVIRGIPPWLLQEYMQDIGGESVKPGLVRGEGWQVELERIEDYQIGSLRVCQVQMILVAEKETYDRLKPELDKKLLRAGG